MSHNDMMIEILEEIRGLRQEVREQSRRIAELERALAQSGQSAPGGTTREENRPETIGQAPARGRAVETSSAPEPRPNIAGPTPTTAWIGVAIPFIGIGFIAPGPVVSRTSSNNVWQHYPAYKSQPSASLLFRSSQYLLLSSPSNV